MKLANTTSDLSHYPISDIERVRILKEHGFQNIDLSFYSAKDRSWDYLKPGWEKTIRELAALKEELGVSYVQAHAPNTKYQENDEDLIYEVNTRAIEICGMLGIPHMVYHAFVKNHTGIGEHFALNKRIIERLLPAMEANQVGMCIENSCYTHSPFYRFFDGELMREFLDEVDHPLVNACWDTGHANIEGHQYADILALGPKLKTIHFNDNFGKLDDHMMPFSGTMSIDEVMHGLIDAKYAGYFTFECGSRCMASDHFRHKRNVYADDNRLFEPPMSMAVSTLDVLREIGEHILKTYDCYEP